MSQAAHYTSNGVSRNMTKNSIQSILLAYIFLTITTLILWNKAKINDVTGDEPHYLVMASGIAFQGTFEQTQPYKEEFKTRKIFTAGLAPEDATPSPENTHSIAGPHGLFNIHSIGLPLLLALPFLAGGVIGAKLFMIFCGAAAIVITWKITEIFSGDKRHRYLSVLAMGISLPLIPASNQIYPDIIAGFLALTGLYWFLTTKSKRTSEIEIAIISAIAFLPWLQIKFAGTCALLVAATTLKIYIESRDYKRILNILLIVGISCGLLAAYNYYAFGKVSGPYQSGALEVSEKSFMVLLGLCFDQNQGFLLQNPINLIGVISIGWIYHKDRALALLLTLTLASLIVPNAMHPNWYGGGSFSGRFGWSAGIVFMLPTTYGLLALVSTKEKLYRTIICLSIALQLYFFYRYAITGTTLYNNGPATWLDNYSIFYFPLHTWLPMLYDSSWAYNYIPNYAWTILIISIFCLGFAKTNIPRNVAASCIAIPLAFMLIAGLFPPKRNNEITFLAKDLPSQTGKTTNSIRIAQQSLDSPGFVNFGPYFPLRKGQYELVLKYKSAGPEDHKIADFDIYDATSRRKIGFYPLYGTANNTRKFRIGFKAPYWNPHPMEFRTNWNGTYDINLYEIVLRKIR